MVPMPTFSQIQVFSVNSGALTPVGPPVSVADGVSTVAVDPGGKFLFAPNPATGTVTVFTIQSDGSLVLLPSSPFAAQTAPVAAAVDLTSSALYVANSGSTNVSQFKIGSDGALTGFSPATVSTGANPGFITVDPGGKFIFVGNIGGKSVTELSVKDDGSLAVTNHSITLGVPPRSIAVVQ
jgi:6-phosphogluconolactonase (cycloisomerase 2 family)